MKLPQALPCLVCGLLAGLLVWLARAWTPVQMLEALAYDARVRAQAQPLPDPPLIVTLNELSREPRWHDRLAELLTTVRKAEPKAVLLDLLLTPGPDYEALAEAVLELDPILICSPTERGGWIDPDPALVAAVTRLGHVDPGADFDGVARAHRGLAGTRVSAAAYLAGVDPPPQHWIRYSGPAGSIPTLSWQQVLKDPTALRGRLVLLGTQSQLAEDWARTPFDGATGLRSMSGVEVLAQTVQSLRSPAWQPLSEQRARAVTLGLGLFGGMTALLTLPTQLLTLALAAAAWLGLAWSEQLSPTVIPALGLAMGALAAGGYHYSTVERGRARLRRLFSRPLAEPLTREVLRHPESLRLQGQHREISVLAVDLEGLSETLAPEAVLVLLNQFFNRVLAIVDAHQGALQSFTGRELRALFNAPHLQPDHARRAVRAALKIRDALGNLEGVTVKLGVETGPAVLGQIGMGARAQYTGMVPAPQTAPEILVSRATAEALGDEFELREQGQGYIVVGARTS